MEVWEHGRGREREDAEAGRCEKRRKMVREEKEEGSRREGGRCEKRRAAKQRTFSVCEKVRDRYERESNMTAKGCKKGGRMEGVRKTYGVETCQRPRSRARKR
eukprot:5215325-Pleurochrysis_carterae.AAC.1